MKRLKLGTDSDDILWQEKKLVQAKPKENNLQMNELSLDLELLDDRRNWRSKTLITMAVTSDIPPKLAVIVPLTAKGQVSSPECFFFPRDSGKGKLIAPQGLISITQKRKTWKKEKHLSIKHIGN